MHKWGTAVLAVLHLSHCKLSLSNGNSKAGLPLPTLKEAGEGPIRIKAHWGEEHFKTCRVTIEETFLTLTTYISVSEFNQSVKCKSLKKKRERQAHNTDFQK